MDERPLCYVTGNGRQLSMACPADDKRGMEDMRSKPRKKKRHKLSWKNAAKALAKLISRQEDEREQNIAQFERELSKKMKKLRRHK